MLITIYKPVCGPIGDSKKGWFRVNGAIGEDRDEVIKLASQHVSIRDGECEIKRVDEIKMHDWEYYG